MRALSCDPRTGRHGDLPATRRLATVARVTTEDGPGGDVRPVQRRRLHRPRRAGLRRARRRRRRARPAGAAARGGELTYAEIGALARRQAARLDELGIARGRAGGDRQPQQRPAADVVLRRRAAPAGCWCRSTSGCGPTRCSYIVEHSGARVLLIDPELEEALGGRHRRAPVRARRRRRPLRRTRGAPSRGRGSRTRTRRPASTTPRARRRGPRACRSPTATSGSTRSPSRCTPPSPTATSTCTRCRCSTPTAGGCRSR